MKNIRRIVSILLVLVVFVMVMCFSVSAAGNSGVWDLNYTNSQYANDTIDYIDLYSSGSGYTAYCTELSGTAPYRITRVSNPYSSSVDFTATGSRKINYVTGSPAIVTFTVSIHFNNGGGTVTSIGSVYR